MIGPRGRLRQIETAFQGPIICRGYRRTWAFPQEVAALIEGATADGSVLHLFGGRVTFGLRIDADRATAPHVVGNAFFPPFRCESFDSVVCDPPYDRASNGLWAQVLVPAACLARHRVWWFSTYSLDTGFHGLKLLRWWAVMPSSQGELRYLAELERTRHPYGGCWPRARDGQRSLAPAIRKFDWRSRIDHPNLPGM